MTPESSHTARTDAIAIPHANTEATFYVQNKWVHVKGGSGVIPHLSDYGSSLSGDDSASSGLPYSDSACYSSDDPRAPCMPLTVVQLGGLADPEGEDGFQPLSSPMAVSGRGSACYISPSKGLFSAKSFDTPLDEALHSSASSDNGDNEGLVGSMTHSPSLDNIVDMVLKADKAILDDVLPELTLEGTSGTYFVNDCTGTRVGVFKPQDEEVSTEHNPRGLSEPVKASIPSGESWKREIAAYRLDHAHFAGVPETFKMRMPREYFHSDSPKVGSFQRFVKSDAESWDVLPGKLPTESVHRIAVLDIRLCNSDRHGGNVLVCRGEDGCVSHLVPIDHGCCLPTDLTEIDFEWLMWPQSKKAVSEEVKRYVSTLDEVADEDTLIRELGIAPQCAAYCRAATVLLKKSLAAGLTLYDVGTLMRRPRLDVPSELEDATTESRGSLSGGAAMDFAVLEPLLDSIVAKAVAAKEC
eukprot:TRINITY_DN7507_c3_g1_i1.p1 TRINITY_DN7507_c3_g1~~TRINITY_DN7507_c3_g1_i1.p1  ORF type:complete len:469 (+),score=179.40 TRINITY_DN7507_c3_g1_i1:242-1648(+)